MIYFSDFGNGGPIGDATIAVQDFTTGTTTGSFDYTSATISGLTPKAVLAFACRQAVADEPSETAHAYLYMAGFDGTTYRAFKTFSEDGQTTTDTKRAHIETAASNYEVWNGTGVANNTTATPSLISGGINLNYATNAVNYRQFYVAFAGADLLAEVDGINLGTGTSALSVSTGFEPDLVIAYSGCLGAAGSVDGAHGYTLGFALPDGTQRCIFGAEIDAAADGSPYQSILTDRCAGQVNNTNGALSYAVTAGNFTGSGFEVTPSANTGSDRLFFLSLNFGGRQVAVREFNTPVLTGDHAITGIGFEPQFALLFLSGLETSYAAGSHPGTQTSSDLMSSLAICAIGNDEQWTNTIRIDSGAGTTDTATLVKNTAMILPGPTGTTLFEATLNSFTSGGMSFNVTTAPGTPKKGIIVFVE